MFGIDSNHLEPRKFFALFGLDAEEWENSKIRLSKLSFNFRLQKLDSLTKKLLVDRSNWDSRNFWERSNKHTMQRNGTVDTFELA